jgi:UDP-N-acetylglucosamine 2-epimerase (non-hydrolysing)/UDP-GlcNAc3NAcA epimerase
VHGAVELVGDVMVDVALATQPRARAQRLPSSFPQEFVLATAHRAGNVDDPQRLRALVDLLRAVPGPVMLPLHPRTHARLEEAGLLDEVQDAVFVLPPLGPLDFNALLLRARAVLTDSGGVQKEAYLAGVPCVTLRDTTEWVETVEAGWNVLVDLDTGAALRALERTPPPERPALYGDGHAGERVVAALTGARYA